MTDSWRKLAGTAGADDGTLDRIGAELVGRYSEPHRRYHTLTHIEAILPLVRGTRAALAAWFHDAIYDTTRHDNERLSAALAVASLRELRFDDATIASVEQMIVATSRHDPAGLDDEGLLFLDADLSILGAAAGRYDEYARQVREEYAWVPEETYRTERAKILAHFLERPAIYFTASMREQFEEPARQNVEREIPRLRAL
jgi:predicted metal-dependent HD superfamily phosphohydrolase